MQLLYPGQQLFGLFFISRQCYSFITAKSSESSSNSNDKNNKHGGGGGFDDDAFVDDNDGADDDDFVVVDTEILKLCFSRTYLSGLRSIMTDLESIARNADPCLTRHVLFLSY